MRRAPQKTDPAVHSFLALRRVVGYIAFSLPFALVVPWWAIHHGLLPAAISSYYYTGMRDLFVGALCAIGIINLCCKGYDRHDTVAGVIAGLCAIGVAFFPTTPDHAPTHAQEVIGTIHILFATSLFLTLAYFCLVLFTSTAHGHTITRRKRHRNVVYRICGCAILASIAMIMVFKATHRVYLFGDLGAMFFFESMSMFSFGVAWMVKGGTVLKDALDREKAAAAYLEQQAEMRKKKRELAGA